MAESLETEGKSLIYRIHMLSEYRSLWNTGTDVCSRSPTIMNSYFVFLFCVFHYYHQTSTFKVLFFSFIVTPQNFKGSNASAKSLSLFKCFSLSGPYRASAALQGEGDGAEEEEEL